VLVGGWSLDSVHPEPLEVVLRTHHAGRGSAGKGAFRKQDGNKRVFRQSHRARPVDEVLVSIHAFLKDLAAAEIEDQIDIVRQLGCQTYSFHADHECAGRIVQCDHRNWLFTGKLPVRAVLPDRIRQFDYERVVLVDRTVDDDGVNPDRIARDVRRVEDAVTRQVYQRVVNHRVGNRVMNDDRRNRRFQFFGAAGELNTERNQCTNCEKEYPPHTYFLQRLTMSTSIRNAL